MQRAGRAKGPARTFQSFRTPVEGPRDLARLWSLSQPRFRGSQNHAERPGQLDLLFRDPFAQEEGDPFTRCGDAVEAQKGSVILLEQIVVFDLDDDWGRLAFEFELEANGLAV